MAFLLQPAAAGRQQGCCLGSWLEVALAGRFKIARNASVPVIGGVSELNRAPCRPSSACSQAQHASRAAQGRRPFQLSPSCLGQLAVD